MIYRSFVKHVDQKLLFSVEERAFAKNFESKCEDEHPEWWEYYLANDGSFSGKIRCLNVTNLQQDHKPARYVFPDQPYSFLINKTGCRMRLISLYSGRNGNGAPLWTCWQIYMILMYSPVNMDNQRLPFEVRSSPIMTKLVCHTLPFKF